MKTKNIGTLMELSSENGYIHKIGTESYFKKGIITDSIDNYEEVTEMPKYTRHEYVEKVRELIKEKYQIEDELALQRNAFNALMSPQSVDESKVEEYTKEYSEYNDYCNSCKVKAKEILSTREENI